MSVERLDAEGGSEIGDEEKRRRERAIRQSEFGSAREADICKHLLELVDAILEVGQLLADKFFVASLRIQLTEQRAQRRLKVQVMESRDDSHLRAPFRALGHQRRRRILVLEVLVDNFGLGDE